MDSTPIRRYFTPVATSAGFVEKAAADLAAWEGLDDDEDAQAASGQTWATARWTRHVYATASRQAERLPDDQGA